EPFGVTVNDTTGEVYVAISNSLATDPGYLRVIDPLAAPIPPSALPDASFIALPASQTMSVLDPDLGRLFVTMSNKSLAIVDVLTRSLVAVLPNAGAVGIALDRSTHRVYASTLSGVAVVDATTNAVVLRRDF